MRKVIIGLGLLVGVASVVVTAAGPERRVVDAARERDAKGVAALIRAKADVNQPAPDGATALHWAAHFGDVSMAEALIKAGADVNVVEDGGVSPLALAATNGDAAMVERLLKAGANPNAGGGSAIMAAARTGSPDVLRLLLDAGGDPNAKEPLRGQTALMWAAAEKHPAALRLLIGKGADVKARTQVPPATPGRGGRGGPAGPGANGANGYTALLFATRVGHLESVRVLLDAGADVNDTGADGLSALLLATVRGHAKLAVELLDKGADAKAAGAGFTALHWAAGSWETELTVTSITPDREGEEWATIAGIRDGRLELVKSLLAHGADVNAQTTRTPPRVGSSKNPGLPELEGATPFLLAAVAGHVDVMRELKAAGADIQRTTKGRATPLMAAAGMGRVIGEVLVPETDTLAAAKYILELGGVDVNAADDLGNTALHYAAFMRRDSIVQLLSDRGATLDVRNKWGETPLFLAEVVIQFAGGGRFETGPTPTGALLRKLGAQPSKPDYTLRPFYWPNIPHV
ncbi:MAG: ankyrin repeat domain-containing protein [Vicinamibacterales bacterium]